VKPPQVVWSYAGVRPLLDDAEGDPSAVTRDYLLETGADGAPLLTVWGGKITTFRKLAEEAGDAVGTMLGERRKPWSRVAFLPGGDLSEFIGRPRRPDADFEVFLARVRERFAWLPPDVARRCARAYGSRIARVLAGCRSRADLGAEVAPGLFEAELRYLQREEWATDADDVLWRRSKLGLHCTPAQRKAVHGWFERSHARADASR
jgi:glycerol-3-phosphate dehydrogenase